MTPPELRAVIFDLDGVIWDGEPLYAEAFNVVLKPYGHSIALSDPDYIQIIGKSVEAAWEWMRTRFALTAPPAVFYRAYNQAVLDLIKRPAEPLPAVRGLLSELRRRGVPIGLASASLRPWVDATLEALQLQHAFDVTVSASEVQKSKPAPDLYLAAAERLGVPPEQCLAVEDTASGIASAKAAGMVAVQVRTASTAMPPLPEADFVIEDYSQFDLGLLTAVVPGVEP